MSAVYRPVENSFQVLCDGLDETLAHDRGRIRNVLAQHAKSVISEVSVGQLYGGLRGVTAVICDTSEVHYERGLIVRKSPVKALAKQRFDPPGLFWFLLTGKDTDYNERLALSELFNFPHQLPEEYGRFIATLQRDTHPVVAVCSAMQFVQLSSVMCSELRTTPKSNYWRLAFYDALVILSSLPTLVGTVFHRDADWRPSGWLSWGEQLAEALDLDGRRNQLQFRDLMDVYVLVHCDHEGSNACALACRTAASTLADPYLALTAGWRALAGPIHGLASQVCIEFIDELRAKLGDAPSDDALAAEVQARIASGRVIPGFGHAVLRAMDPRYELLHAFGMAHFPDDPAMRIADGLLRVVPPLLQATGKVANPWPNVDGISGAIMQHYGLSDYRWLTVLFAACMSLGLLAQMVVSRGLGEPIVHPKAITPELLRARLAGS